MTRLLSTIVTSAIILLLTTTVLFAQDSPRLVLILTGGGARGIAQVGVLKELERRGLIPDAVVGTSIGAIVGGLYASGYTAAELDSMFRDINWDDVTSLGDDTDREQLFFAQKAEDDRSLLTLRFRNFRFLPPKSISAGGKFASFLQDILWRSPWNSTTDFDSLFIPFRAVGTNLVDGSWVALDTGNLATALRASASFPLRYAPVRIGDKIIIDGGLVANIPYEAAAQLDGDVYVVVNTVSDYLTTDDLDTPLNIADQAVTAAMKQRDTMWLSKADVVITPELGYRSTFDFSDIESLIRAGERAAIPLADSIQAKLRLVMARRRSAMGGEENPDSALARTLIRSARIECAERVHEIPEVYQILDDVVGRGWSPLFARYHSRRILDALHNNGLDLAYIRNVRYEPVSGAVVWTIDDGRVRNISINPARHVDLKDALREFTFDTTRAVSANDLSATAANLRASELFDDVDMSLQHRADTGLTIVVGASDRGNQVLRLGARIDNERFTQGSLEFANINVLSTGIRSTIRAYGSERIGELAWTFDVPRIAGTLWTASAKAYGSFRHVWIYGAVANRPTTEPLRSRIQEFSEDRYGLRLSAGRQLERGGVVLGEFRYEQQRYRDLDSVPMGYQPLATLRLSARWDDRDFVDFATHGRVVDIAMETSLFSLSNGLSFTKITARTSTTVDIGGLFVTPSFMIGAADRTLPGPELFSLGGQDMFFGMREDEERGKQILVGNLGARTLLPVRLFWDTWIGARYDIGAIWANPENIRIGDMQHGLGLTLGVDTPVGPAMLSLGRRFYFLDNPAAVAWGPVLAYFSVGMRL